MILNNAGENTSQNTGFAMNKDSIHIVEMSMKGELKEVGLIHFLPAIAVAFVWNYLLSGFIIASYRATRYEIGKHRSS